MRKSKNNTNSKRKLYWTRTLLLLFLSFISFYFFLSVDFVVLAYSWIFVLNGTAQNIRSFSKVYFCSWWNKSFNLSNQFFVVVAFVPFYMCVILSVFFSFISYFQCKFFFFVSNKCSDKQNERCFGIYINKNKTAAAAALIFWCCCQFCFFFFQFCSVSLLPHAFSLFIFNSFEKIFTEEFALFCCSPMTNSFLCYRFLFHYLFYFFCHSSASFLACFFKRIKVLTIEMFSAADSWTFNVCLCMCSVYDVS